MKKVIKTVDTKRSIVQVTVADERWYLKPTTDSKTGLPTYVAYPSVTWISGYWPKGIAFYKWLANKGWDEAEAVKEAAGNKGSAVHLAISKVLSGEELRIDDKIEDKEHSTENETVFRELTVEELLCVKSFLDWKEKTEEKFKLKTLAFDKVLFSEKYQCAGIADWVVKFIPKKKDQEPSIFVVDFKTSQNIWREYELQVNAYCALLESGENPILDDKGKSLVLENIQPAILQLGYHRNQDGYKFSLIEKGLDLFLTAQSIWKAEIGKDRPGYEKLEFPLVLSAKK